MEPEGLLAYCIHKSWQLDNIVRQLTRVHISTTYLFILLLDTF
jgi:hypothetical protein